MPFVVIEAQFRRHSTTRSQWELSTIADADASVAPSLQIRSDGLGAYTNSKTLSSIIQGAAGAWVLDSRVRNATRRVFLDFGQPVTGTGPNGGDPVSVPSAAYLVRIISKCNQYNTSMWAVAPGATITCPLHFAFDYGGATYGIQMNPTAPGNHARGGGFCRVGRSLPRMGACSTAMWRGW